MDDEIRDAIENAVFDMKKCNEVLCSIVTLIEENKLSQVEYEFVSASLKIVMDKVYNEDG